LVLEDYFQWLEGCVGDNDGECQGVEAECSELIGCAHKDNVFIEVVRVFHAVVFDGRGVPSDQGSCV